MKAVFYLLWIITLVASASIRAFSICVAFHPDQVPDWMYFGNIGLLWIEVKATDVTFGFLERKINVGEEC